MARAAALAFLVGVSSAKMASAQTPSEIAFKAERMTLAPRPRELVLEGRVEVGLGRARIRGESLHLISTETHWLLEGDNHLALCPCPNPPLTFAASRVWLHRDGDVRLRYPRIEAFGVPIIALPYLWLRPPEKVGFLPPYFVLRGSSGVVVGSGVHLPFPTFDGSLGTLDLRAGSYLRGGFELGATLTTPQSRASFGWDENSGARATVEAQGVVATGREVAVTWEADVVRGPRARSGTVDLPSATRPFDTALAETSLRVASPVSDGLLGLSGILRGPRGEGSVMAGPRALGVLGGALGRLGSWNVEGSFTSLGVGASGEVASLGRAAAESELNLRPGPFDVRMNVKARLRMAEPLDQALSTETAAGARLELALPLARAFSSGSGSAPWVNWLRPSVLLGGSWSAQQGNFFLPPEGSIPRASWLVAASGMTALARPPHPPLAMEIRVGSLGDGQVVKPLAHGRLGLDATVVGGAVEAAVTRGNAPSTTAALALQVRARLGLRDGPSIRAELSGQSQDAGQARAVASGSWATLPTDGFPYFTTSGWTSALVLSVPWSPSLRTMVRSALALPADTLLEIRGGAEYRHPCGCFALSGYAAHRVGRDGVDLGVALELAP